MKLEYHDGEVVAMAGGTESHSLIITNVIGELRSRLKDKPCRVYAVTCGLLLRCGRNIIIPTCLLFAATDDSILTIPAKSR